MLSKIASVAVCILLVGVLMPACKSNPSTSAVSDDESTASTGTDAEYFHQWWMVESDSNKFCPENLRHIVLKPKGNNIDLYHGAQARPVGGEPRVPQEELGAPIAIEGIKVTSTPDGYTFGTDNGWTFTYQEGVKRADLDKMGGLRLTLNARNQQDDITCIYYSEGNAGGGGGAAAAAGGSGAAAAGGSGRQQTGYQGGYNPGAGEGNASATGQRQQQGGGW